MRTWQLQEAKNHLNEVVRNAISDGPQNITLHGKPAAVVVSYAAFFQGNKAICQAF
ncbi:MAG: type II toxin-antitoxin system Phd/YefM family antitoxin [Chlorobiaceae bacterium]|nr:type II toxin-antitoxin system Phd/YefM family antitoxin [Chlorobiaceae bacterium]